MDKAAFKNLDMNPEEALFHLISEHPLMAQRMALAERVTSVRSAGDYSYRANVMTGERWMLAGDAAGFIDPVFSTGVFLALLSGEESGLAIDAAILGGARIQKRMFAAYEKKVNRIMDLYLGFVNRWYQSHFIELFVNPTSVLGVSSAVNAVLSGESELRFALRWRLWVFYLLLEIQKFIPLCPRIHLPTAFAPSYPKGRGLLSKCLSTR
jgi:2-polyprenyl-6-methoxyphenol hydroxylase-like FAD-dependent oxidoreductase